MNPSLTQESADPSLLESMRVTDCPPFAWHCFQIAWFHANPLPDINLKYCRNCEQPLPSWEQHRSCEKCRGVDGTVRRHKLICQSCGNEFMGDKKTRRFCNMKCAGKGYKRKDF